MALDLPRVRALCFDVDGTIADTDDHIVAQLAACIARLPLVSGRRAERLARQGVMAAATPVNAAYGLLDRFGLDTQLSRLRERISASRARAADPAGTRNIQAADQVPHDMMAGVKEMLVALATFYPMSTISTGSAPRVERFLEHYGVRKLFAAVVGSQTTVRMKPSPDPLLYAAAAMGVEPAACLMIGDTTVDIRTGIAAGAQTVGVLCGFGTEDELVRANAGMILRTTSDLLAVLHPAADALGKTASPQPGTAS
ncbi:HAD family hydrolase [Caenimonas terrae]|uniref:phosphoglycolate phosphatase n=1 Tax=Caenimonas terrae TaxID=696074 RepID=A0ABW0N5Y2_9BURK